MNPLSELQNQGQSIWLDFITREILVNGHLNKLIRDDGLQGVTSNPTIFQKAIGGSRDYDASIESLIRLGKKTPEIFEAIAVQDIQQACDLFRPVYERTQGQDGFVSLEVNPHLARDRQGTLTEARRLFHSVQRKNVMIKIPGTHEGLSAIEQALGEGININITLIFSLERYQEVMEAWISGLERLAKSGKGLSSTASVASFFVSRVDTLVDSLLEKKRGQAPSAGKKNLEALFGRAAIANAQCAYQMFLKVVQGSRFKALETQGAHVQRPLWASTSTKNPRYRDVVYVEELIGKDTVNTLPPQTLEAFRDHGRVRPSLTEGVPEAYRTLTQLQEAGIDMKQVTRQLEEDGVRLFADSYDQLIQSLEKKKEILKVSIK